MPKKKNYYWTEEVNEGIQLYQNTSEQIERSIIYKKYLEKPFKRMSEIIVRKWKFQYLQEDITSIVNQCESFMVMKIPNFNMSKGNSFSYFTIVLKNYLIQLNNSNYEKLKTISMIQPDGYEGNFKKGKNTIRGIGYLERKKNDIVSQSMDTFTDLLRKNEEVFTNSMLKRYENFVPTLIEIVEDRQNTYHYHKKKLLELFRTKTGLNTQQLIHGLKRFRYIFKQIHEQTKEKGEIDKVWEKQITTF